VFNFVIENLNPTTYNLQRMTERLDLNLITLGAPLPNWSLEKIFEEEIPQKETLKGKPLLILFFSLGCPGCLGRAIPYANRVVFEHGNQINVLGIHTNFEGVDFPVSKFEKAKEEFHVRFPFFKDANFDTTFLDYGAGGTPHWILVDKDWNVVYSIFGSDPNNALLRLDLKITEVLYNR
jgi:thiol-disulfide isomerase/thioredoxin